MLYSLSLENCEQLRKWNRLYRSSLYAMFFFNRYLIQSVQSQFVLVMTQPLFRDIIAAYCIEIACQKCFSVYHQYYYYLYIIIIIIFIIIIIIIIITFILIQEKGFTESLLNWKTSTSSNSAQLPFLYVITQTLERVNVDLELDYLHLLKTNFNNYTQSI